MHFDIKHVARYLFGYRHLDGWMGEFAFLNKMLLMTNVMLLCLCFQEMKKPNTPPFQMGRAVTTPSVSTAIAIGYPPCYDGLYCNTEG